MAKFTHYLVTRFNVIINGNGPEFIQSDARTSSWEIERTRLFETFCAPTVSMQSNQNFTWLIYCDTHTSEEILKRIRAATHLKKSVHIVPVSSFDELLLHLRQLTGLCTTPFVITSRLDNDDGIGINFINDIQSNFVPEDLIILNPLSGVNYNVSSNILTLHRYYPNNSFTSLIEKTKPEGMITIMGFNHLHPLKTMRTINLKRKYSFWRTLHQENTAVRGNRGWPLLHMSLHKFYKLDYSHIQISTPHMLLYSVKWFPRAFARKILYLVKRALSKQLISTLFTI